MNVLILAGDTDGNVGDRAIVLSTCLALRRSDPNVRITLVSGRPEEDQAHFSAETIPRGWRGIAQLATAARRSDLVLCGGGGLFHDDASLVKMPYWAVRLAFVRLFARRLVGYSLGVGPLDWSVSRLCARLAFSCFDELSVRDEFAQALTQPLTSKPVQLVPDPAVLLPPAEDSVAARILATVGVPDDGSPVIGVAVRRWFHHHPTVIPHKYAVKYHLRRVRGQESCARMTSLLAEVLDRVREERKAHIVFLPTYGVSHEGDDRICEEVGRKMQTVRPCIARITEPRAYKAVSGRLSVLLGGRMHATIMAAAMGTPVVGLSYNLKFEGFFRLIDREDRVMAIEDFVRNRRVEDLSDLLVSGLREGRRIPHRLKELTETTRICTVRLLTGQDEPPVSIPRAAPSSQTELLKEKGGSILTKKALP
jgi:polysaccharide pyruvyl transferase WcaK-like protein